jgi:hypothetical protein
MRVAMTTAKKAAVNSVSAKAATATAPQVSPSISAVGAAQKTLWVVSAPSIDVFVAKAKAVGATSIAVRTDNDVASAITKGHAAGLTVFGWRWPLSSQAGAMKEANSTAALFSKGLDGYYMDIEGAKDPKTKKSLPFDWDQPGLEAVATQFCQTLKTAAAGKPLGLTSHYRAAAVYPSIPWSTFAKFSDVFLPQSYWNSTEGIIGHGDPADNYDRGILAWSSILHTVPVVPMGGELGSSTASQVGVYVGKAKSSGRPRHYYTHDKTVAADVWTAVTKG